MKYRKKPVVIEAMQWDGTAETQARIVTWSGGAVSGWFDGSYFLEVRTLEGTMRADVDDWVIHGTRGEFYPCKPEAFNDTFEAVEP